MLHGLGVHIHDLLAFPLHGRLAFGARLSGVRDAFLNGFGEHGGLPAGVPYLGAEALVIHVVGAQGVAVHEQGGGAVEVDDRGVRQQAAAAHGLEARTHEKVAVAGHDMDGDAAAGQGRQGLHDGLDVGEQGIVAEPDLEQVAEDVQRLRLGGFIAQEPQKQLDNPRPLSREMQVGNEQRRHLLLSR